MHSRVLLSSMCLYLALIVTGCNKPAADISSTDSAANDAQTSNEKGSAKEPREHKDHERREAKKQPLVVPSGTEITISLGSTIGSKVSKPGDTFTGSVARDVMAGNAVAIPQGASVSGTVTDAKPIGRFKGGAVLQVRLDSVRIKGADVPVQAAARSFSAHGKRTSPPVLPG